METAPRRKKRTSPLRPLITLAGGTVVLVFLVAMIVSHTGGRDAKVAAIGTPTPTELTAMIENTPVPTEEPETPVQIAALDTQTAAQDMQTEALESQTEVQDTQTAAQDVQTETPQTAEWIQADAAQEPVVQTTSARSAYVPQVEGPGYLPVFRKAETTEKIIVITVDDCFQTENLSKIVSTAESVGGKLTIFPIGRILDRSALQDVLRYAHSVGFEIENHTFSHSALYDQTDAQLAEQIFNQDRAIDAVLGENYQSHFLRPRGGDDRNDIRTHAYLQQMGYKGVAHWSISGSGSSIKKLKETLGPGEIYLFHTTDSDLEKLLEFIPYAANQGYQLVTLNEMFGYADNEVQPLTDDPVQRTVPALGPYERDYKTIKKPTYSYAVYEVQQRLKDLGFTTDEPDGVYGSGTEAVVKNWQKSVGVPEDGVLTPELQHKLLDT